MNQDIKDYIEAKVRNLSLSKSISVPEAEKRAGDFLSAMARITDWRHQLSEGKIKALSVQTAVYATKLAEGTAKTMTENKVTAEASEAYIGAREELEESENDISYLKAYYEIFQNAHVFFRQISKGENF